MNFDERGKQWQRRSRSPTPISAPQSPLTDNQSDVSYISSSSDSMLDTVFWSDSPMFDASSDFFHDYGAMNCSDFVIDENFSWG